jgi:hypothetical protein
MRCAHSVAEECGLQPASGRCKNMFLKSKKGEFFAFCCQVCQYPWFRFSMPVSSLSFVYMHLMAGSGQDRHESHQQEVECS